MSAKVGAANLITGSRILFSVALLFCPASSMSFYVLYLVAGMTDMIDGAVARMTGTSGTLGVKLDSAADAVFVSICLWKLLPCLAVPLWLWIWIVLIVMIKMINAISGYVIQKAYVALHTAMNKVTGILLFLLPLVLPVAELKYSAPLVCAAATFAAIQEGCFIRRNRPGAGRAGPEAEVRWKKKGGGKMTELNTERLLFWFHKDESGKPIWKDTYVYAVTERYWKSVMHEGKTVI